MSRQPDRKEVAGKRAWVKPELKVISAGSAEADLSRSTKDGANPSARS